MKEAIYLSGSIEYSKDPESWRKKIYRALHNEYNVIIPKSEECPFMKYDKAYKDWIKENFILPDMVSVATSLHFFVKLDDAVFKGAGTISEITTASWLGKRIVYYCDNIKEEDIPGWTLGCLSGATKVETLEEAIKLYKTIAQNKEK